MGGEIKKPTNKSARGFNHKDSSAITSSQLFSRKRKTPYLFKLF